MDSRIWVEHHVEDMVNKIYIPNICHLSQGCDDSSRDDDVIRFDDNEEERTSERNEGFVKVVVDKPTQRRSIPHPRSICLFIQSYWVLVQKGIPLIFQEKMLIMIVKNWTTKFKKGSSVDIVTTTEDDVDVVTSIKGVDDP